MTPQTHHTCLYLVSVHQTVPPLISNCSLYYSFILLFCQLREDERLSWPSYLTYSGRFIHING